MHEEAGARWATWLFLILCAVAVVRRDGPARGEILTNVVRSQWAEHSAYGGVVPEIAARAHVECIAPITRQALAEADLQRQVAQEQAEFRAGQIEKINFDSVKRETVHQSL